jgi:hypothetical protein
MGDNEAEGQQQPPADDKGNDETTGGPGTSAQGTGAPATGTAGTGEDPATGSTTGDSDDGGIGPDAIYGGG